MKQHLFIAVSLLSVLMCNAMDVDIHPRELVQAGKFREAISVLRRLLEQINDHEERRPLCILLGQSLTAIGQEDDNIVMFDEGRKLLKVYDSKYRDDTIKSSFAREGFGDIIGLLKDWIRENVERVKHGQKPMDLYLESYRCKTKAFVERSNPVQGAVVYSDPDRLQKYTKTVPLIASLKGRYHLSSPEPKLPYLTPDNDTLNECKQFIDEIYKKGKIPVALTWISGSPDENGIEKPVLAGNVKGAELSRQRSLHVAFWLQVAKKFLDKITFVVTQGPGDEILSKEEFDKLKKGKKRHEKNLLITPSEFKKLEEEERKHYSRCLSPTDNIKDLFAYLPDKKEQPFERTLALHGLCPVAFTSDTLNLWAIEAVKTDMPIDEQRTGICCIPKDPAHETSNVDWRHKTKKPLSEGPSSRWHNRVKTFEIDPTNPEHIARVGAKFAKMLTYHEMLLPQNIKHEHREEN